MGFPLSPILADIVMQDLEVKAIKNLDFEIPVYYRYVDDILLITPANRVDIILNSFNSIHNRLQFTVEYEKNRSISFLDLIFLSSMIHFILIGTKKKHAQVDICIVILDILCVIRLE